jgi:signal transduction histidine kinase
VAVILGLLVVLSGLISRGVSRPIEGLSAASRDVAAGGGSIPETPPTAAIEIRELYEDFRAMAEAIDRRSRYLRDFAAAVSHEFKTPLAGIQGAVELMEDHGASMSDADRARFLDNIRAGSQRLSHLVSRLLDMARADMARPGLHEASDLGLLARRHADSVTGPDFAVDLRIPAGLPQVAAPEAALDTVLAVLIDNSRKAGARRVSVQADQDGGQVRISVADDGQGVPEADRERLFEPFFTSRRGEGGTGLGLPIARSLLAASQGTIAFDPAPQGARFVIVLRIAT